MMNLDKQHPLPVYLQLKEVLRSQIEQGIYFSHQKLPSERDLCQNYNLSRMTARRALQQLIAEGFAYTRAGKGTFVNYKLGSSKTRALAEERKTPAVIQQKLIAQLLTFNAVDAEQTISEALAIYPLETVALKIFPEIIRVVEQQWQSGQVSLLAQNYVINMLRSQLTAMVNAASIRESGPKVLLACAPEDQHEIGLLLLALSLRRRGFLVVHLGPNVPVDEFHQVVQAVEPQLICFSAATTQSITALAILCEQCQASPLKQVGRARPGEDGIFFTFGGVAFNQHPELISRLTSGLYLGNNVETAVTTIQQLLLVD